MSSEGVAGAGRSSELTLRTLNAFAVDVMSIRSSEDLFWYVARNVVGKLNFIDCVIYEADGERNELRQVAALGEKNPYDRAIINPLRIPFGEGITGRVAASCSPVVVSDLLNTQSYIPDTVPARSEICVPLVSKGRVVGVIDSEHPEPNAFGEVELEVLTTVAAMTSAKLELLTEAERSARRYGELVRSHAQLAEEVEVRKSLEAELFEARKLEAIGRLTGGFAHSFNNILTIVSGNLEMLGMYSLGDEARWCIDQAEEAAGRGAELIRDMLAFSQRMHLRPKPTDLNGLVRAVLERNGRATFDAVELDLASDAWRAHVDPAAAEIAVVNLMLNAHEAMTDGGTLKIGTGNVSRQLGLSDGLAAEMMPGRYVRLHVTDEGPGMEQSEMQRIFDPFYTTKPTGQGVGLGLSTVQGFMKQSGGAITARSAVPNGTTFELYFPASD